MNFTSTISIFMKIALLPFSFLLASQHVNKQETIAISNSNHQDTIQAIPANIAKTSNKNSDNQAENSIGGNEENLATIKKASHNNEDCTAEIPLQKRKLLIQGFCKAYHIIPTDFLKIISYFTYCTLPKDLSKQDLRGFDFTGYEFTYTNLTDANLQDVILTSTTCDYQKAFQDNLKKNKCQGGDWYKKSLPQDLEKIANLYSKLDNNSYKAKLLQIAAGVAWLPFYQNIEFYIKVAYWSAELLQLRIRLDPQYEKKWIEDPKLRKLSTLPPLCSFQRSLRRGLCWVTIYPQNQVGIKPLTPHANFDKYLKEFKEGVEKYIIRRTEYYKNNIPISIASLAKVYPNIKNQALQQEACNIAQELSQSYQKQRLSFLLHYLWCQNRLISLKKSLKLEVHYIMHDHYGKLPSWHINKK